MANGGTNWATVALVAAGLLIWNDGCAGKATTAAVGTGAAVGAGAAAGTAAAGGAGALGAAAARGLARPSSGQHFRKPTSQRPSSAVTPCTSATGLVVACPAPPMGNASDTVVAGPPCAIRVEPRPRQLAEDHDRDGQPDTIMIPELTCS